MLQHMVFDVIKVLTRIFNIGIEVSFQFFTRASRISRPYLEIGGGLGYLGDAATRQPFFQQRLTLEVQVGEFRKNCPTTTFHEQPLVTALQHRPRRLIMATAIEQTPFVKQLAASGRYIIFSWTSSCFEHFSMDAQPFVKMLFLSLRT